MKRNAKWLKLVTESDIHAAVARVYVCVCLCVCVCFIFIIVVLETAFTLLTIWELVKLSPDNLIQTQLHRCFSSHNTRSHLLNALS